jgi:voltage-gated potassium channel Kch
VPSPVDYWITTTYARERTYRMWWIKKNASMARIVFVFLWGRCLQMLESLLVVVGYTVSLIDRLRVSVKMVVLGD